MPFSTYGHGIPSRPVRVHLERSCTYLPAQEQLTGPKARENTVAVVRPGRRAGRVTIFLRLCTIASSDISSRICIDILHDHVDRLAPLDALGEVAQRQRHRASLPRA